MQALVNGIECDSISIADRAVLYGDSLFETVAVRSNQPLLLDLHLERLAHSAKQLHIDYDHQQLLAEIEQLMASITNQTSFKPSSQENAVLRITLSRGTGGRGYKPAPNLHGTRILSLHAAPQYPAHYKSDGITLGLSELRLAKQTTLAGLKHGNRLEQVLASMDIQDHYQDVVLRDNEDNIICCSKANLFALMGDTWVTPDLSHCGIAGVMRSKIQTLATELKFPLSISNSMTLTDLQQAQAIFISNSLIGIWPVKRLLVTQPTDNEVANDAASKNAATNSIETIYASSRHCSTIQAHLAQTGCTL